MHKSVLLDEVIKYLDPKPGENFVDCTIGGGGHATAILKKVAPSGRVLGIDWDWEVIRRLKIKNQISKIKNLILVCDNFANLKKVVRKYNFHPINGILFDLGLSGWQIEESGRGFSFRKDEPLNMAYSIQNLTAAEIVNHWSKDKLAEIFIKYGEEKYNRRIAQQIIKERKQRPIRTTFQLRDIIKRAVPYSKTRRGRIDRVLARIFQALRIVVNDELENLKQGLEQALEVLNPGNKIVVISFHSLEDRIIKNFFKEKNKILKILTKKPIIATSSEIQDNPRSRSAKLRAAIKL